MRVVGDTPEACTRRLLVAGCVRYQFPLQAEHGLGYPHLAGCRQFLAHASELVTVSLAVADRVAIGAAVGLLLKAVGVEVARVRLGFPANLDTALDRVVAGAMASCEFAGRTALVLVSTEAATIRGGT